MFGQRTENEIKNEALEILKQSYGDCAEFRQGQLEAIMSVVKGRNSLVIEKTGWGKSLVYFIATRILRHYGAGPTLIISPLLVLMSNQIESARVLGVNAVTINSDNKDSWSEIYSGLQDIDALIVSPERLANEEFMNRLSEVRGIQLLVVDEAHLISDWGHDFRPDYQRIIKLLDGLPGSVTVLGTTATANTRVIDDIKNQLGKNLEVIRGSLIRDNLAIQVNPSQTREQRLSWLAEVLIHNEILAKGQGIIYCLTHADCKVVAEFLSRHGVSILPYYSGMGENAQGESIEQETIARFAAGSTRILSATTKLGMGYDKLDVRFVIHFQLPQNLIAYYQQIGRAGRDGLPSYAFLLHGYEDEEILSYFISSSFTSPDLLARIVDMAYDGVSRNKIMEKFNIKLSKLEEALKYLRIHDYIYKDGSVYRVGVGESFDEQAERIKQQLLKESRNREHLALLTFLESHDCFMNYIAKALDAPDEGTDCGICSNCRNSFIVPVETKGQILKDATQYLDSRHAGITPRKRWGSGGSIPKNLQLKPGWALYADYYSTAGQRIRKEKYKDGDFSQETVELAGDYLRSKSELSYIDYIVPVPSLRHPCLVPNFAKRLAELLEVSYVEAVEKTKQSEEQKSFLNGWQQEKNIKESIVIIDNINIDGKVILLVDDMVDSRWTFTVIGSELLNKGAKYVYPFALVRTGGDY